MHQRSRVVWLLFIACVLVSAGFVWGHQTAPPAAATQTGAGSSAGGQLLKPECEIPLESTLHAVTTAIEGISALADAVVAGTDQQTQEDKRQLVLNRYVADGLRDQYAQLFATSVINATQSLAAPVTYSVTSESKDTVVLTVLMASFASTDSGINQQAGFVDVTMTWQPALAQWQISALKNRALDSSAELTQALTNGKRFCHVPAST